MSSTGQIIGTVVGAIIGFFIPGSYVALAAALGGMLGSAIDPPKGPKIEGPRLSDLSVQGVGYGNPIPRLYGSIATFGTIFWVENNALKETATTEEQGGKGGGGQEVTTYSYSATFALALCQGPISGIKRIWIAGKLVYDGGATTPESLLASMEFLVGAALSVWKGDPTSSEAAGKQKYTLYTGTDTQMPDPRMQAALGVANTPAYRGLAYIVFEDLPLEDYGNTLMGAQIKVEVCTASENQSVMVNEQTYVSSVGAFEDKYIPVAAYLSGSSLSAVASVYYYNWNGNVYGTRFEFFEHGVISAESVTPHDCRTSYNTMKVANSDKPCAVYAVASTNIYTSPGIQFRLVDTAGYYDSPSAWDGSFVYFTLAELGMSTYTVPSASVFNGAIYLLNNQSDSVVSQISGDAIVNQSATGIKGWCADISESYLFVLYADAAGNAEVNVLDLTDLSLVDTHTFTVTAHGDQSDMVAIQAVSDTEFWVLDKTYLRKFINGVEVETTAHLIPGNSVFFRAFDILSTSPSSIISWGENTQTTEYECETRIFNRVFTATPVALADIIEAECLSSNLLDTGDLDTSLITDTVRGYKVTQTAAIRAALEPLQGAWPFDAVQSGYQIAFIPRGQSSVATADISELGAVAGNDKAAVRITNSREMDLQLPRRVEVVYIDAAREYDTGAGPGAERLNTDAINILKIEMAIVLNANEAAQIEERLLYMYWLERNDIRFTLPPTFAHLEAADVITINGDAATYEVRLTAINALPDGRLECSGKFNNAAIYTSTAVGDEGAVTGQVLALTGSSAMALLDIPCVDSAHMDQPGLLSGLSGYIPTWPGGAIIRSADQGQTWQTVQGFLPPGMSNGTATNALATGVTHIVDTKNAINVTMNFGEPVSVSELSMFNGANHFVVGAHGRWEIIAAKTVVEETDGSFTLSNLMRGRFGTEQYMDDHAIGDTVVLLDTTNLRFLGMSITDLNMARLYRGVTKGRSIDSAIEYAFTWAGENLECRSPVYLNGNRNPSSFDWTLTWTRRTRTPVETFSGIATPLGETAESYDVEIWNSDYSTLLRTFSGLTSASATYTSAQQVTDFGGDQATLYVKVYQNSATLGRGHPLVSSIYRTAQADAFGDYVKLLMHWTSDMADVMGHTVTASGAAISGGYAVFDGVDDYVTLDGAADLFPGMGDFTYEMLVTPVALSRPIWWRDDRPGGNGVYLSFYLNTTGEVAFFTNSGVQITSATGVCSINNEYHLAACRSGTSARLFINGTQHGITYTDTNNYLSGTSRPLLMGNGADPNNSVHRGSAKVREVRYTAAARYTANFTPPTSPLPDPN